MDEALPQFAEVARSEGFSAVAKVLEMICVAEKQHSLPRPLANVESGTVFKRAEPVVWRC